jgi:hypothetical protein
MLKIEFFKFKLKMKVRPFLGVTLQHIMPHTFPIFIGLGLAKALRGSRRT